MRLFSLAFLASITAVQPALAHDTPTDPAFTDPALHCAALMVLSGEILAADGQASDSDLADVREIAGIMMLRSALPVNQRADALRVEAARYRKTHSTKDISADVARESDGCVENFIN